MLGFTSKNYYKVFLMRISWLHNLFHDLKTIYTRFKLVLSKMTKFWKLITWATNVKIRQRKHYYEARNSGFHVSPLYVPRQWLAVVKRAVDDGCQKLNFFFLLWPRTFPLLRAKIRWVLTAMRLNKVNLMFVHGGNHHAWRFPPCMAVGVESCEKLLFMETACNRAQRTRNESPTSFPFP